MDLRQGNIGGTPGPSRAEPEAGRLAIRRDPVDFLLRHYIQLLLVVAVVVLGAMDENFRSLGNFENILLQASFTGIGAAGMTLLIISGAFDLSVAGILGTCGIALALLSARVHDLVAVPVAIALGAVLGLVNGLAVTKMKIPAFIATLGLMNVYLGLAFIATQGQVVGIESAALRFMGTEAVLGFVPIPFLVMILVYMACAVVLRGTMFGRHVKAVGSSEAAALAAGIPVDRVKVACFVLVGLCTAIAGVLLSGELSSANAIMASGYELGAIAVVVVGGTSLQGGSGTLVGSFTGALFFAVLNNALNIFGVGAYWQYVASGLLLISAVGVQELRTYAREAA
jgi:ribose transport system permease protein